MAQNGEDPMQTEPINGNDDVNGSGAGAGKCLSSFVDDGSVESHRYYLSRRTLLEMLRDRGYDISDSEIDLTLRQFRDLHRRIDLFRLRINASHVSDPDNKVLAVYCETGAVRLSTIRLMSHVMGPSKMRSLSSIIIVVQSRITTQAMKGIADYFECKVEIFQMTDLVNYTTKHELKPMYVVVPEKVKVKEKEKLVFKCNWDALKVNLDAKQGLQASAPVIKGVQNNHKSPGGNLEKTFGDSVTTAADKDKGKRKIESSKINSPDSKRNKLMTMFNEKRKVIDPPATDKRIEKPVEVAAPKPVVRTCNNQGSNSDDAIVGSSAAARVQEQTNKDISDSVATALATLVSYCPEICRRLELHGKQSDQVTAEKRETEAEVERLQKLVADLRQSCSAETLLRMKTELELSEMKKTCITDHEKHATSLHEKDTALNEAKEEVNERGKLLRELTEKTEALTKEVTRLREDKRWLIAEGIPRSFEVIRSSGEYMEALTELTTTADLVGRLDGMVEGSKIFKDIGRVKDYHNYRKDARKKLVNAFEALSDVELPIVDKLTATAELEDLSDLKALLVSPGRDEFIHEQ